MSQNCKLESRDGYTYLVGRFPEYVLNFVRFKIPAKYKKIDKETNQYGIQDSYFSKIKDSFTPHISTKLAAKSSPYAILYLTDTAPIEVVKAAYRALSKMYHPDLNPGNEDKMIMINEAYNSILTSEEL
jgi:DnaJ-class molecular chaperone